MRNPPQRADPTCGGGRPGRRIHTERKLRNHIAQLTAMGYRVTLEPAA